MEKVIIVLFLAGLLVEGFSDLYICTQRFMLPDCVKSQLFVFICNNSGTFTQKSAFTKKLKHKSLCICYLSLV